MYALIMSAIVTEEPSHGFDWITSRDRCFGGCMIWISEHASRFVYFVNIELCDALAKFANVPCFHTSPSFDTIFSISSQSIFALCLNSRSNCQPHNLS